MSVNINFNSITGIALHKHSLGGSRASSSHGLHAESRVNTA